MTEYVDFAFSDLVFFKLKKNVDSAFLFSFTRLGYQKQTMFFNPCLSFWQNGLMWSSLPFVAFPSSNPISGKFQISSSLIRTLCEEQFIDQWNCVQFLWSFHKQWPGKILLTLKNKCLIQPDYTRSWSTFNTRTIIAMHVLNQPHILLTYMYLDATAVVGTR